MIFTDYKVINFTIPTVTSVETGDIFTATKKSFVFVEGISNIEAVDIIFGGFISIRIKNLNIATPSILTESQDIFTANPSSGITGSINIRFNSEPTIVRPGEIIEWYGTLASKGNFALHVLELPTI